MRRKTTGSRVPSGTNNYFFLMAFVNIVVLYIIHNIGGGKIPSYKNIDTNLKSYDLAFTESFGFFDDIENHHWLRQKQKAKSSSLFKYTANPEKGIENLAVWILDNLEPMFTCPHIARVGGLGDGAKWTCDPHRLISVESRNVQDCLVYSIGSAGRYQFEEGISKISNRQCEIHVFDPNPKYEKPNMVNKNITYHAWGIKSSYAPSRSFNNFTFRTILDTIERLGHNGRRIDVFKIDCEGCEWSSYKDWLSIDIRQILIETHPGSINKESNESMATFFQDMYNEGFIIFSKEANTHPAIPKPGTMHEFGFLRLSPTFFD